jgi:hypothetical protein
MSGEPIDPALATPALMFYNRVRLGLGNPLLLELLGLQELAESARDNWLRHFRVRPDPRQSSLPNSPL